MSAFPPAVLCVMVLLVPAGALLQLVGAARLRAADEKPEVS